MKVLVSAASKHGSTAEIAEVIAETMRHGGTDARHVPIEEVKSLEGFDAVVLGSAVYAGRWMKPARELVEHHGEELKKRPVWLFSSGPVGEDLAPEASPEHEELNEKTGAREHRLFPGNIDRESLSIGERAIVAALRAPTGDYRDFDQIRQWATHLSEVMTRLAQNDSNNLVG